MARGYDLDALEGLIQEKEGGLGFLKQAFGNTIGKWAMKKRRPVGYETDKTAANVMADPEEENWTNTTREALYSKLFGQEPRFGGGIYTQDDSGAYILNPDAEGEDAQRAKEIQVLMNETFAKARQGDKVSHPDFPDAGENFYRGTDKTLGEAYFDEEGNVVDYWDIGLDKGEKVFDWKSILPGGEKFINKANLQRALVDPFTTPATFKGKATDTGNILGKFSGLGGDDADTPAVPPTVAPPVTPTVAQDEKQNLFQKLFSKKDGPRGFQGEGGGSGVKTAPVTVGDYASSAKGPYTGKSSPIQRKAPIDRVSSEEGGGPGFFSGVGDNLGKLFGAAKGAFNLKGDSDQEWQKEASEKLREGATPVELPGAYTEYNEDGSLGGGPRRDSILTAFGFGGLPEGGEDYQSSLADKLRGLFPDDEEEEDSDYLGTAQQNIEMLRRMGGKGPSIVDFLKSQGRESSFEKRRQMWDKFG